MSKKANPIQALNRIKRSSEGIKEMKISELQQRFDRDECVWIDPWEITGIDFEVLSRLELEKGPDVAADKRVELINHYLQSAVNDIVFEEMPLDATAIVKGALWLIEKFGTEGAVYIVSFKRHAILPVLPMRELVKIWRAVAERPNDNPRVKQALRNFLEEVNDGDQRPIWIREIQKLIDSDDYEFVLRFFEGWFTPNFDGYPRRYLGIHKD
ncbi:MAG: hypothetical protein R3E66_03165 [bacterium]